MNDKIQEYDFILEQEVLKVLIANKMAQLSRYMNKVGVSIDDNQNPITIFFLQLGRLENTITLEEFDDVKKLDEVKGYVKYAGEYINRLCEIEGIK